MSEPKTPALTDSAAMGGIHAKAGFGYQIWDALLRLPAWLKSPSFEGVMFEGFEDTETRFFAPHAPHSHLLDRYQAKSGVLDKSEIVDVVQSFKNFSAAFPGVARVQTLVTPQLPPKLAWISRDPDRVRRARPFFAPFVNVANASDVKLRHDLIAEFEADLGGFLATEVEVFLRPLPDMATMEAAFAVALHGAFPRIDVGARKAADVFKAMLRLGEKSLGVMLRRHVLVQHLEEALGESLGLPSSLALHLRSDNGAERHDAVEIDAARMSGVDGVFPEPDIWMSGLVDPLNATARWARSNGYGRIAIGGQFRLSTGFAVGHAFRAAVGFEIDIPTREHMWATDGRPAPGLAAPTLNVVQPEDLNAGRLVVALGVIRNPSPDVRAHLSRKDGGVLEIVAPDPVPDAQAAQRLAADIKATVSGTVTRLRPSGVDLFFVGPSAFAVALGHRWNGVPATQLYEYNAKTSGYAPTVVLR